MKKITFTISAHVRAEQSFLIPDELEINTSDLSRTYKDVLAFNGLCEHHNVLANPDPILIARTIDIEQEPWKLNPKVTGFNLSSDIDEWTYDLFVLNCHLTQLKSRAVCALLFDEHFYDEEFKYFTFYISMLQGEFDEVHFTFDEAFYLWNQIKDEVVEKDEPFDYKIRPKVNELIGKYLLEKQKEEDEEDFPY
jgi:hypothetical protein